MKAVIMFSLLSFFLLAGESRAGDAEDIQRLEGYAAVLGRGGVCGMNLEPQFYRVAAWVDMRFAERAQEMMEHFFLHMEENTKIQVRKEAKEPCDKVRKIVENTIWP